MLSRAKRIGGKTPLIRPCRIFFPVDSPSKKLSQLNHGYASIKLEILDKRPMNATTVSRVTIAAHLGMSMLR